MSQHMDKLSIGEMVKFRGPLGRFSYAPNMKRFIGMIAGGTGITPMFQVIKAILENPRDRTKISLIFGNITEDDILLQHELNTFQVSRRTSGRTCKCLTDDLLRSLSFSVEDPRR